MPDKLHQKEVTKIIIEVRDTFSLFEDATKIELNEAEKRVDEIEKMIHAILAKCAGNK